MSKKVFSFQNSLGAIILSAATAIVLFAVCGGGGDSNPGSAPVDPPADPSGACTIGTNCTPNVLQSQCVGAGGTFVAGGNCSGGPVMGSCTVGSTCTNNVQQAQCTGTFVAGGTCPIVPTCTQGVDCPTDLVYCGPAPGGCTQVQRSQCPSGASNSQPAGCTGGGTTGYCWFQSQCHANIESTECATYGGTFYATDANCGQSTTVTYYCPTACTAQTGPSVPTGCFTTASACQGTPPPPPGECDPEGSLGYCCFPGECWPMGPEQTEHSDQAIVSAAQCTAQSGRVSSVCDPRPIIGYCGWTPGDVTSCVAVAQGDMNPDHPNMTQEAACKEWASWYTTMEQCQADIINQTVSYCNYGFGNIVQGTCTPDGAPASSLTDDSQGFYCDFGDATIYGAGGCFFRPSLAAISGALNATGDCDNWATRVSMTACIASNASNPCMGMGGPVPPGTDGYPHENQVTPPCGPWTGTPPAN